MFELSPFDRIPTPQPEQLKTTQEDGKYKPVFDTPKKIECIKERTQELIEDIIKNKSKILFFLDRSARPYSYMLQIAWDEDKYGPMPKIKFLNIGREKGEVLGFYGGPPPHIDYDNDEEWIAAVEDYWNKLDSKDYISNIKIDISNDPKDSIMIVDDCESSGFTMGLARSFIDHHFPERKNRSHLFFKDEDKKIFNGNKEANGIIMPWYDDKSYTLLSDEEDPTKVIAKAERNSKKRSKGIALRKEIKQLFN
jgi:hypothetical protein